ncbi:MAG: GspB domain-containing protein [Proteobacteria bacterium]|nr:GspB domain-containing protein [Pseudomonadota bacterium]
MSSILKALKKLEHEKSGHFTDPANIDVDILEPPDYQRRSSPLTLTLLFLIVFGAGVTVAFFLLQDARAPLAISKSLPVPTPKSISPQLPPPAIHTETLPAEIVIAPARTKPSNEASNINRQRTAAAPAAVMMEKKSVKNEISRTFEKPKMIPPPTKTVFPVDATIPTLKVNGIAFQNSSADSMALVNGKPVSCGSIIEGVTVEEVRKDRVLFQQDGKKFEIRLGQSNR